MQRMQMLQMVDSAWVVTGSLDRGVLPWGRELPGTTHTDSQLPLTGTCPHRCGRCSRHAGWCGCCKL